MTSTKLLTGVVGACIAAGTVAVPAMAQAPATTQASTSTGPLGLGVDTTAFDRSVRPQDDFYQFVNGGWLDRTEIPADRSRYGSFDALSEASQVAVREIIEEAAADESAKPGSNTQKIRDMYRSYMDTVRIERLGAAPVKPALAKVAALSSKDGLPELFAWFGRHSVSTPFAFYVSQDAKNATRYIASVTQSGLGLPDRDYYLKDADNYQKTRAAYEDYVATLFRLADQPQPEQAAKNVIAFENSLAQVQWARARNRDREATYNLKTVEELNQLTPHFSWTRYIQAAGAEKTPGVVVRQPDYLQALDSIVTATPLPVLKQYLTFKVLNDAAPYLSSPFAEAQFDFYGKELRGQEEERPRWKRGVSIVNSVLGEATGELYVEKHFSAAQKARMEEMVDNLLAAYKVAIDELEWMSPATKKQAQAKLAKFNVKIGYPDEWRDYSALTIQPGDLFGNLERASEFQYNRMIGRLGQPIDRGEWGMTPQTVNAYYNPSMNEIVFPAAILQPPFFNPEADDAVNYGAIGAVIGHEISHGFDDQGARSDGDGNLRNWWTPEDLEQFKARTDALAAQYSAYEPVPGTHINGRLTLGENIGDLSGLTIAYKAYKRSLHGKEAPVIGGFTGDQRFFLGFAQIWRAKQRAESLRQQLLTDPHSPPQYRGRVPLMNMPEFYAAFHVQPGDGMYLPPDERVKIW
ncbi:MAG TPA: M13 family metallopeptidase [Longimicrobiaceae bacterium]|nr:M13 family metallopeptidase [Longimicrobiaceae bacterium]